MCELPDRKVLFNESQRACGLDFMEETLIRLIEQSISVNNQSSKLCQCEFAT